MWCHDMGAGIVCPCCGEGPKGCGCEEDLKERCAAVGATVIWARLLARRCTLSIGGLPRPRGGIGVGGHGEGGRDVPGVDCGDDDDDDDDLKLSSLLNCC